MFCGLLVHVSASYMWTCGCHAAAIDRHRLYATDLELTRVVVKIISACVQLLSKSLDQIKDESWFAECGDAFIKHIPLYANIPDEKVNVLHLNIISHRCVCCQIRRSLAILSIS